MSQKSLKYLSLGALILFVILQSCKISQSSDSNNDIVIENSEFRFVIDTDGTAKSLIHKATGKECLMQGVKLPLFGIKQDYPYDNENKLAFPAKQRTFGSNKVIRNDDKLIVNFERTDYEATVGVEITDSYIVFTLDKLSYKMSNVGDKRKTRIDEFILLQIPVKDRTHFGEWLNVMWDKNTAVNLLAVEPACMIDAFDRPGYKVFQAAGFNDVKLIGISAGLITTTGDRLLDVINTIEHDYGLPLGVESRRRKEYKNSYYEISGATPENIDEHIAYAKKAGFKQMVIYYMDFAKSMGHFGWKPDYPNGINDLERMVKKIKDAGMIPGFHIHYNKAQINDPYVTPVPDPRLNIRRYFTLRQDIDKNSTTVVVEENPTGCTLDDDRRILKIGNELISYENYTTTVPYKFTNCKRGYFNTKPEQRKKGDVLGLLDIDTWPEFVRFNQRTDIQNEVAERLEQIIDNVGFQFLYYDGAEDVPPPYWYNVSKAQLDVYNKLKTKQLFAEGAQKSHFSWHILTRGNAFDDFPPEVFKEGIKRYPLAEAKLISNDFSSIDFGWIHPVAPDSQTIGLQPDMLEYAESRSAGWNSIISLVGNLEEFKNSPRTDDNLEVIRRWEEVRENGFLTDDIKKELRESDIEHILLINEQGNYELVHYEQIVIPESKKNIRAFVFTRHKKVWVVYWHTSGSGILKLNTRTSNIHLYEDLGTEITPVDVGNEYVEIPLDRRRYIQFDLTRKEVIDLFENSVLKKKN
ncbi:MAG: hypothetical protein GXO47_12955 [Chlorobi bacterium]|nr:hypothetical protein [Chlorobiota bacterium]